MQRTCRRKDLRETLTGSSASFYLSNKDTAINLPRTECVAQSVTATTNQLGEFPINAACDNKNATFTLATNKKGRYYLDVVYHNA